MMFVAAALLGFSGEEAPAPSSLRREALIIFSRHGIRVPYAPPGGIAEYSKSPVDGWFPNASDWGADGEAYLTEHGAAVISRMGAYHRQLLVDTSFLPSDGSKVTIYADDDPTGRDVKTALAFFDGLLPGVTVRVGHTASYIPALFNQGQLNSTACPGPTEAQVLGALEPYPNPEPKPKPKPKLNPNPKPKPKPNPNPNPNPNQVLGTIGGDPRAISEANRLAIQRLSDAVDCCRPAVCPDKDDATGCTLAMQPTSAWTGLFYQFYRGPFWSAASLTEYLQLLYLNNMSLAGVAPGLGAAQLSELMLLHQSELDVTEDQIATQSFGSDLLAHLLATMQQLLLGRTLPGLASHRGDKLVYYAGHDLNLYFLRNFLRLNWLSSSWNSNEAMPGGMLQFELLSRPAAAAAAPRAAGRRAFERAPSSGGAWPAAASYFVKVYFVSASYEQQRTAAELTPAAGPDRVFVTIPQCATGPEASCPLEGFRQLVLSSIRAECVSTVPVDAL